MSKPEMAVGPTTVADDLPPNHPPVGDAPRTQAGLPPNHPPIGGDGVRAGALPANHPSVGGESPVGAPPSAPESPALSWKMPADWQQAANPNALRLATYRTPGGAEMSVARAGGTTEANIQRWRAQFDQAGADTREEKTIRGMHVTVVQVTGTFEGGGMGGGSGPQPYPGWALLGAIVETSGSSYFFKLLGPASAIGAARASFDELLKSVKPS
jgi:hypothetical protein